MIDLKPYAVFAEVVAAGSMSAAARRLGMTPSAVSQIVANLERRMGVTLLHRSTRRLTLTEAGERCYPHSLRLLEAGRAAAASLEEARDAPSGELRIAAPVGFGAHLAPALAPVLADWPRLRLRLILDDALIDLVEHRIDLAIRVGWQDEGYWHARTLGELELILCAAPAYLAQRGNPQTPADLLDHDAVALRRVSTGPDPSEMLELNVSDASGALEKVALPMRIATTNQIALQQMCEQAMGIACLFHADAHPALKRGALVRVLPRWRLRSYSVTLLTPQRDSQPGKVRVATAAIERHFALLADTR